MKKELKLGIFAVSIIVVSFFVLNYLKGEDIFNKELELVARFESTQGLAASAPVNIKGYKAGKVVSVEYDKTKKDFVVTCSVSKDFCIPSDSRMTIYSVDIMGGKGVKIDLGSSEETVADGDTLTASFEAGLMDSLGEGMGPLLAKVTSTLDSLSVTISEVNCLLNDSNKASISRTLRNLESTMYNLKCLSASINGKSGEISTLVDNLTDFTSKLSGIAEKIDTTMTGVNSVVGTLNESDIDGLVSSFKSLLESLNNPEGSIGKLMADDSVYNSVDSLLIDVNSLIKKISENPKKYLKISVF